MLYLVEFSPKSSRLIMLLDYVSISVIFLYYSGGYILGQQYVINSHQHLNGLFRGIIVALRFQDSQYSVGGGGGFLPIDSQKRYDMG